MTIFMVTVIVLLAGCGVKPEKHIDNNVLDTVDHKLSNQGKELGETPPQPIIKADGKALMVYQSSYCWNSKSKGICADYASPNEMLKDKSKEQVKANVQITYEFDVKMPTEITVSRFNNGTLTQVTLNGDSFQTPQENGVYYYSLSAVWLKDKAKRISEGSSNYAFAIEVVGY
jgi:hypothetical protein